MGRMAKDTGGGDFQQAPTGTHPAICVQIVDIGTQHSEYQGKPTARNQIIVRWELPHEQMDDGQPFIVSRFYTNSLSEKANLRADLEGWRGRKFTEEELNGFDLQNILGKPCLISIISNEKGKSIVNSVMALPKGSTVPKPHNKPHAFWIDEWDDEAFAELPKGFQDLIRKSDEYIGKDEREAPEPRRGSVEDMDDDIPFADPYKGRMTYVV